MKTPVYTVFLLAQLLSAAAAYGTVHVIEARNFFYAPASLTLDLGDTVRFVRIAGTHPTESTTGAWPTFTLNSSLTSYDFIPTAAGTYPYVCTIHSGLGMVGSFTVVNTTPPCGPSSPPTGLSAVPGTTSAVVSWNFLPNTQLYQLQGRPAGAGPFRKRTTTATSVTITGLLPANTYEWQVRALCVGTDEITIWSPLASFSTLSLRQETQTPSNQPAFKAWQNGSELFWTCTHCPNSGARVLVMDMLGRMLAPVVELAAGDTQQGTLPLPARMNQIVYVVMEGGENPIAVPLHVYVP